MIVVSDTSPLSNLIELDQLYLLPALFDEVVIPSHVATELLTHPDPDFILAFRKAREEAWLTEKTTSNRQFVSRLQIDLDQGEAEAIALTLELNADALLIDERAGYRIAQKHQILAIGVLGVLVRAKSQNLIPEVKPLLDQLRDEIGFYLSNSVYQQVLSLAGEIE